MQALDEQVSAQLNDSATPLFGKLREIERSMQTLWAKLQTVEANVKSAIGNQARIAEVVKPLIPAQRKRVKLWSDPGVAFEACEGDKKLVILNCGADRLSVASPAAVGDGGSTGCEDKVTQQCGSVPMRIVRECSLLADLTLAISTVGVLQLRSGKYFAGYHTGDGISNDVWRDSKYGDTNYLDAAFRAVRRTIHNAVSAVLAHHGVDAARVDQVISRARQQDGVVFIDCGAQLGASVLYSWAQNVTVVALEAMPLNHQLLRVSRCINEKVATSIDQTGEWARRFPFVIVPFALTNPLDARKHRDANDCAIVSEAHNTGTGIVECGWNRIKDAQRRGYMSRGMVNLRTMDQALIPPVSRLPPNALYTEVLREIQAAEGKAASGNAERDIATLLEFIRKPKLIVLNDMEGTEVNAISGAAQFLTDHKPLIFATEMRQGIDVVTYFRTMHRYGYVGYQGAFGWIRDENDVKRFLDKHTRQIRVTFVESSRESLIEFMQ